jgi:multisubunit Na+/H+ antiporter MnhE subunit
MRLPAYWLIITAAVLAGTVAGVALGLAAVPVLERVLMRRPQLIDWSGADD